MQVKRCANGILVSVVVPGVATTDEPGWVTIFCGRSEVMPRTLRERKRGFEFGKARSQCEPQRILARKSGIRRAMEGYRIKMAGRFF